MNTRKIKTPDTERLTTKGTKEAQRKHLGVLCEKTLRPLWLPVLLLFVSTTGYAQEHSKSSPTHTQPKDEFSVLIGGGLSGFTSNFNKGNMTEDAGGIAGLGFTHYLNEKWGISIGLEYQGYTGYARAENIQGSYDTKDIENEDFTFHYKADEYSQQLKAQFVNIPLTLQYQTTGEGTNWYIRGGAQVGFPVKASYRTLAKGISTNGEYPQYKATLYDPSFMGFGDFIAGQSPTKKMEVKTPVSAVLETGLKQNLGAKSSVYFGIFLNYGLNGIEKPQKQDKYLLLYQTYDPANFAYPNIFETPFGKGLRPVTVGIKCRFAFR